MTISDPCKLPDFDWFITLSHQPIGEWSLDMEPHCSLWVWCVCDPYKKWKYCSPYMSSCPAPPPDCGDCIGEQAGWRLKCGNPCMGPPCYDGEFYGQGALICRCPSAKIHTVEESVQFVIYPQSWDSCADMPPAPFPMGHPRGIIKRVPTVVPVLLFGTPCKKPGPGSKAAWTWCPCKKPKLSDYPKASGVTVTQDDAIPDPSGDMGYSGDHDEAPYYTGMGNTLWWDKAGKTWWLSPGGVGSKTGWSLGDSGGLCPFGTYAPVSGVTGKPEVKPKCPGGAICEGVGEHWVFRGGCKSLGPPPVAGRFVGETIFIGYCCGGTQSYTSLHPPHSEHSQYLFDTASCDDMPPWPLLTWDIITDKEPTYDQIINIPDPDCAGGCAAWIWCQCFDSKHKHCSEVFESHGGCPAPIGKKADPTRGHWIPAPDSAGKRAPCIHGRFYGEIIFVCDCPRSVSSSSSSQTVMMGYPVGGPYGLHLYIAAHDDMPFTLGGVEVRGDMPPEGGGYYNPTGWYAGMMLYRNLYGWYMFYLPYGDTGQWYITPHAPNSAPIGPYWLMDDVPAWSSPLGMYVSDDNTKVAYVSAGQECNTDAISCPDFLSLRLEGLPGTWCDMLNGDWVLKKWGEGEACYYSCQIPADVEKCISGTAVLTCACGVWQLYVHLQSCDPSSGYQKHPSWTSDPRAPLPDFTPPSGSYKMRVATSGCGDDDLLVPLAEIS